MEKPASTHSIPVSHFRFLKLRCLGEDPVLLFLVISDAAQSADLIQVLGLLTQILNEHTHPTG